MTEVIISCDGDIRLALRQKQPEAKPQTPDPPEKENEPQSPPTHEDDIATTNEPPQTKPEPDVKVLITASSQILCIASPIFKTMLTGAFREASDFAAHKTSTSSTTSSSHEKFTLDLPEDDPEAFTLLLRILHYDYASVPERPTPESLEGLAFLCDKYQCTHVLRYCGRLWARDWLDACAVAGAGVGKEGGTVVMGDAARVLVFAYVADLEREFVDVAWRILLHHKGPIWGDKAEARVLIDHPLFRHDVAGQMDQRRSEICEAYHMAMMAPLSQAASWTTIDTGCFYAAKRIGAYIKWLQSAELMPHDVAFSNYSVAELFDKADRGSSTLPATHHSCASYRCACRVESAAPNDAPLTKRLERTAVALRGLKESFICLRCIKSDGRSNDDGNCKGHDMNFPLSQHPTVVGTAV